MSDLSRAIHHLVDTVAPSPRLDIAISPRSETWRTIAEQSGPQPDPWDEATTLACNLITAATLKAAGARIGGSVGRAMSTAAQDDLDELSPRRRVKPPRPHQIASELLVQVAGNVRDANLKGEILSAAGLAYQSASPLIG